MSVRILRMNLQSSRASRMGSSTSISRISQMMRWTSSLQTPKATSPTLLREASPAHRSRPYWLQSTQLSVSPFLDKVTSHPLQLGNGSHLRTRSLFIAGISSLLSTEIRIHSPPSKQSSLAWLSNPTSPKLSLNSLIINAHTHRDRLKTIQQAG